MLFIEIIAVYRSIHAIHRNVFGYVNYFIYSHTCLLIYTSHYVLIRKYTTIFAVYRTIRATYRNFT